MRILLWIAAISLGASPAAFEAVRLGDVTALEKALDAGASPNAKDEQGQTLLIHAALYLPAEGMKRLIDRGADVNLAGKSGATALMVAAGDLAKVRLLLERGADVNARSAGGNTALRHAVALPSGRETVLFLLAKGAKPEERDLNRTVRRGDLEMVRAMLAAGAPVAPMAIVRALGNAEMLALLEAKAPQYRDPAEKRKAVAATAPPASQATDLMFAAFFGQIPYVERMVEFGSDVNARDNRDRTALMYAAGGEGQVKLIQYLIAKGADPSAKDVRGDTALDLAQQRGRKDVIVALGGKPSPVVDAVPKGDKEWKPLRETVAKSVELLEVAGPAFAKANGCISCHNQSIPQMAFAVAAKAGVPINSSVSNQQADAVTGSLKIVENGMWQLGCTNIGGYVATLSYDLVGLGADRQPRSLWTDLASNCLAKAQRADGSWRTGDQRHPLGISDSKYTALSIRALLAYPLPGLKEEYASRVARAVAYLETSPEKDTQSLAFQILGLKWAGKTTRIPELARRLEALQRPNHGWAQHPEMAADAYATAVALWALHEGAGSGNAAWTQGATYLRRLQKEDGSWHLRSRGFGFQPYRETGFPHGHDQWISSATTGFAILALAPLL